MKKILLLLSACFFFSCDRKPETKNPLPAPTEIDAIKTIDGHNSRNSLEYLGTYQGTLPCADCSGIQTSLELSEDFSYTLTQKYLGKSVKSFEYKGTFSWTEAGNSIVLDKIKSQPNKYLVKENMLQQLDMAGNMISGKLSEKYILKKVPESEAAKTDALEKDDDITAIHWTLTELKGKAVRKTGQKDYFVEFAKKGEFSAFAGCNSMGGKFKTDGNKIKISDVMSTLMACEDMQTEDVFKASIETADNFIRNEKSLQLRKGNAIIAKFEALPKKMQP